MAAPTQSRRRAFIRAEQQLLPSKYYAATAMQGVDDQQTLSRRAPTDMGAAGATEPAGSCWLHADSTWPGLLRARILAAAAAAIDGWQQTQGPGSAGRRKGCSLGCLLASQQTKQFCRKKHGLRGNSCAHTPACTQAPPLLHMDKHTPCTLDPTPEGRQQLRVPKGYTHMCVSGKWGTGCGAMPPTLVPPLQAGYAQCVCVHARNTHRYPESPYFFQAAVKPHSHSYQSAVRKDNPQSKLKGTCRCW